MQSGDDMGEPTDQPFPERTIPVLPDDDDPPARGFLAASLVAGKVSSCWRRSTVGQRRDLIAAVRDLARGRSPISASIARQTVPGHVKTIYWKLEVDS
jgi:hypothetical protein